MDSINSNPSYAEFTPLPPSPAEILKKKLTEADRLSSEKEMIQNLNIVSIKSDYLNMTRYYYGKAMNKIFGFCDTSQLSAVSYEVDKHLREINNLPPASNV
jgi:hypothetical protein